MPSGLITLYVRRKWRVREFTWENCIPFLNTITVPLYVYRLAAGLTLSPFLVWYFDPGEPMFAKITGFPV